MKLLVALCELKGDLPSKFKPHKLTGPYNGFWECHIQNDWLLVWAIDENEKTILLTRTHSDLF